LYSEENTKTFFIFVSHHSSSLMHSELNKFDALCELFSFFTRDEVKYCRSVCRWCNDLLTKDNLITTQVNINDFNLQPLDIVTTQVNTFNPPFDFITPIINQWIVDASKRFRYCD
jgi:hypothetical protein